MSDYLSTGQAAAALGVSPQTIVNYVQAGKLDAHRLPSGHRRISRESVDRLREERGA